jgi:hypothetical protein
VKVDRANADKKSMAEFSEQDVGVLPPQDLERIYQLLKSKSIKDFWEVGSILDARFKKRAPYGHWPKIEAALRALGRAWLNCINAGGSARPGRRKTCRRPRTQGCHGVARSC